MNPKSIDDNYITVQGWMVSKLNLKGAKLMAFALIYGFCQDRKSRFRGSVAYIAKWAGTSDRQAQNVLNELQDSNLIVKTSGNVNGIDPNEYTVNFKQVEKIKNCTPEIISPMKKLPKTPEKTSPVPVKKLHPTGEIISPNNIDYNIIDNIEDIDSIFSIEKKPSPKFTESDIEHFESQLNAQIEKEEIPAVDVTTPKKRQKPKSPKILFADTEFCTEPDGFARFEAAMIARNEKYKNYDLDYYYQAVQIWSENGNAAVNWIATAAGFILRDEGDRKAKMSKSINYATTNQVGNSSIKNGQQQLTPYTIPTPNYNLEK